MDDEIFAGVYFTSTDHSTKKNSSTGVLPNSTPELKNYELRISFVFAMIFYGFGMISVIVCCIPCCVPMCSLVAHLLSNSLLWLSCGFPMVFVGFPMWVRYGSLMVFKRFQLWFLMVS